jgi:hypothetical protein
MVLLTRENDMKIYVLDPDGDVKVGTKVLRLAPSQVRDPNKLYGFFANDSEGPRLYEFDAAHNTQRDADAAHVVIKARKSLRERIPDEADRRVNALVSPRKREERQARGLELQDKGRANWTPSEGDEWNEILTGLQVIRNIHSKEDRLLASIDAMTDAEVLAFDPTDDTNW